MHSHCIKAMAEVIVDSGLISLDHLEQLQKILGAYWEDKIAIVWTIEDVQECHREAGIEITDDQAKEVLQTVQDTHDANYGVSWETLQEAARSLGFV